MSSRVRLARNLRGFQFPDWAKEENRRETCARIRQAVADVEPFASMSWVDMDEAPILAKEALKERHLISKEYVLRGAGSELGFSDDETVALMINEEDHMRLQVLLPGFQPMDGLRRITELDAILEDCLDLAFDPRLGYLTACPSNVGTGLRVSVMMHLPGLHFMDEMEKVAKGLGRIGLMVRGMLGEGSDADGDFFQISNQATMGETESAVVERVAGVAGELANHETNARLRLMESRKAVLEDIVARAVAILQSARLLSSAEMAALISELRLGLVFGMLKGTDDRILGEMMILTQPAHLQIISGNSAMDTEGRGKLRARMIRDMAKNVTVCF